MSDSFGDGWNGAEFTVSNAGGVVSGPHTVFSGTGSTADVCLVGGEYYTLDVSGGSYPGEVSWTLGGWSGGAPDQKQVCWGQSYSLHMSDSFGDGWNGAEFTISNADGVVSGPHTVFSGTEGTENVCLAGGEHTIAVSGGSYPSEVSWTLTQTNEDGPVPGGVQWSGGAPDSQTAYVLVPV